MVILFVEYGLAWPGLHARGRGVVCRARWAVLHHDRWWVVQFQGLRLMWASLEYLSLILCIIIKVQRGGHREKERECV